MGMKGTWPRPRASSILLDEGIGDTIRVSLTPQPGGDRDRGGARRAAGAPVARAALVPAAGVGVPRLRPDDEHVLPVEMAQRIDGPHRRADAGLGGDATRGVEEMRVAVMGCVVNGPGESQARRHRHLAAGHVRGAGRAGVRGRRAATDAARRGPRGRVHHHPRRLRGAALRRGRSRPGGGRAPVPDRSSAVRSRLTVPQ